MSKVSTFPGCCSLPIVSGIPGNYTMDYPGSNNVVKEFLAAIACPGPLAPDYPGKYGRKAAIAVTTGPSHGFDKAEEALRGAGWKIIQIFSSCHPGSARPDGSYAYYCRLWLKHNEDFPVPAQEASPELFALQASYDKLAARYNQLVKLCPSSAARCIEKENIDHDKEEKALVPAAQDSKKP